MHRSTLLSSLLLLFSSALPYTLQTGTSLASASSDEKKEEKSTEKKPLQDSITDWRKDPSTKPKSKIKKELEKLEDLQKRIVDEQLASCTDELQQWVDDESKKTQIPALKKKIKELEKKRDRYIENLIRDTEYYIGIGYKNEYREDSFSSKFYKHSTTRFRNLFDPGKWSKVASLGQFFSRRQDIAIALRDLVKFGAWKKTLRAYKKPPIEFRGGISVRNVQVKEEKIFFAEKGKERSDLHGNVYTSISMPSPSTLPIAAAHLSPHIAIHTERGVHILNTDTAQEKLLSLSMPVAVMEWAPNDDALAVGGAEGLHIIQYPKSSSQFDELPGIRISCNNAYLIKNPHQLKWSPDGNQLAVASLDSPFIAILDIAGIKKTLYPSQGSPKPQPTENLLLQDYLTICKEEHDYDIGRSSSGEFFLKYKLLLILYS